MSAGMRKFWFFRLTDGSLCGSVGASDHEGFEQRVRSDAAESGEGVIEHDGDLDLRHDRVDVATGKLVDPVDHAFAADLESKWQHVLRLFPALANPVPPAPVPKSPGGQQSFSVSAFWEDFAKRAASGQWSLRATCDAERLVGPFRGNGSCLEPVFPGGELQWVDPTLPARDGDIVLVKLDALELQRIHERGRRNPEWAATYSEPNPLATKLLKAFAGNYWLCTNGSMFELGNNRILGVVRKALIDGRPAYEVPNIVPNAATETYQISDLPEVSYGLGTHFVVDGTFTPDNDGVVELSASYDYRGLAVDGLGNDMTKELFVQQNAAFQFGVSSQNGAGNSTWIPQSHSDFFPVVGGALVTFGLLLSNGSGTELMRIRNARMKAGFIKR